MQRDSCSVFLESPIYTLLNSQAITLKRTIKLYNPGSQNKWTLILLLVIVISSAVWVSGNEWCYNKSFGANLKAFHTGRCTLHGGGTIIHITFYSFHYSGSTSLTYTGRCAAEHQAFLCLHKRSSQPTNECRACLHWAIISWLNVYSQSSAQLKGSKIKSK